MHTWVAIIFLLLVSPSLCHAQSVYKANGVTYEHRWMIGNAWERGIGLEQTSRYVDSRGLETWNRHTGEDNPKGTGTLRRDTLIHFFGWHFSVRGPVWLVAGICAIVILSSGYLIAAAPGALRKRVGRVPPNPSVRPHSL